MDTRRGYFRSRTPMDGRREKDTLEENKATRSSGTANIIKKQFHDIPKANQRFCENMKYLWLSFRNECYEVCLILLVVNHCQYVKLRR